MPCEGATLGKAGAGWRCQNRPRLLKKLESGPDRSPSQQHTCAWLGRRVPNAQVMQNNRTLHCSPGGAVGRLWRRPARGRGRRLQGARHRQRAHAAAGRARQGRAVSQRHASGRAARLVAGVVAGRPAGRRIARRRLAVPRPALSQAAQQPTLPAMPGRGRAHLARRARGGPAAGRLLPRRSPTCRVTLIASRSRTADSCASTKPASHSATTTIARAAPTSSRS